MSATITKSTEEASSFKMLKAMVGIGVICAFLIVVTYQGTLPRVQHLKEEALQQAIFRVLPGSTESVTFLFDEKGNNIEQAEKGQLVNKVYAGYSPSGELIGLAIEASGKGYADVIKVLYGFDPIAQQIIGFQVLESKETPGLGDKIEKDDAFQQNFEHMDVGLNDAGNGKLHTIMAVKNGNKQNAWEVDGITGATISSRAVAGALQSNTEQWLPVVMAKIELFKKEGHE